MTRPFPFQLLVFICIAAVVLAGVAINRWKSGRGDIGKPYRVANAIEVEIVGKKFQWKFRYPGPDGQWNTPDDSCSERLLFVPPNKNVKFRITSEDYIYILGIPLNKNGSETIEKKKEIAVPELTHFLEYRFTNSGNYDLVVDPLCGFQSLHDPLMGQIVVTGDHEFQSLYPPLTDSDERL